MSARGANPGGNTPAATIRLSAVQFAVVDWIYWVIFVATIAHVTEEYSLGFLSWFRRALPSLAPAMTPRWAFCINALFLMLTLAAAVAPALPIALRLAIPALLILNALLHIIFGVKLHNYSPGVVTGVLLYLPLGICAFLLAVRAGVLSTSAALGAVGIALVLHAVPVVSLRILASRSARRSASPKT